MTPSPRRRIPIEEAFCTPALFAATKRTFAAGTAGPAFGLMATSVFGDSAGARQLQQHLMDLDAGRIAHMDANGISAQVVSICSPGVQALEASEATAIAREANDILFDATQRHPGRLYGLATVAAHAPADAVKEIERGARKLAMRGLLINSHTNGAYLDEPRFLPVLEAAAAFDMPLYLHPREPAPSMAGPYLDYGLYFAGWGFAADTGLHAMRLIMSGLFERLPRLKIVLGHLGEGIPFWLDRIDNRYLLQVKMGVVRKLECLPSEYFRENFWITTSGMTTAAPLRLCLEMLGPDRILFAADHPFESTTEAVAFMDRVELDESIRSRILHENAAALYRLPN